MALIPTNRHNMFWKPRLWRHEAELCDDRCAIFLKITNEHIAPVFIASFPETGNSCTYHVFGNAVRK